VTLQTHNRRRLFAAAIFLSLLCAAPTLARNAVEKTTRTVLLGETGVMVNVYEKSGGRVTFFAPHFNERNASEAAREAVERNGGRLVEIESYDERGVPSRRLRFSLRGRSYDLDPNRVFTENGRRCGVPPEAEAAVRSFAEGLLELILAGGGKRLRDGESFIVAVHNNADVDERSARDQAADLTAAAFVKVGAHGPLSRGAFQGQAAGAYLSNQEADADNFVYLSTPQLIAPFAGRGFNVVVQKPAAELRGEGCGVDDGSLSVYAALQGIPYVCLEADASHGQLRQREMLETVYGLLPKPPAGEPSNAAAQGRRW
jgi:hypothetical protein